MHIRTRQFPHSWFLRPPAQTGHRPVPWRIEAGLREPRSLSRSVLGGLVLGWSFATAQAAFELHVATNGNDAWSGRIATPQPNDSDGPFATIERARNEIRRLKTAAGLPQDGVQVMVQEGMYRLARPLELTRVDSGAADARIVYRASGTGEVRLQGGVPVSGFRPLVEPGVRERLEPAARDQVRQADLRALGVTEFGTAGGGGLELFFQDQPMPLARWPNSGFIKITEVMGKTPVDVRGTKGCAEGLFAIEGDRLRRWSEEPDLWVHGYWFWDWSDQRQRVKALDVEKRTLELEPPHHGYGYRKGQWFYAYNLRSEIDQPGEWYLDRAAGVLYFWPPAPVEEGKAMISVLPALLSMKEVSHVTFQGFIFEAARDTAISITGGHSNRIVGCTIRNVGSAAVNVSGGRGHGVVSCDVSHCGAGGVALGGGDRKSLTPAGHFAENNHIHRYGRWRPMYSAGLGLHGVGNRATHNLVHHAPHQAISFSGNEHRIEFNELHDVCFESNDAGAIYAGRDWTMRGTVIRHNYLHDITGFEGKGCVGVYLDDMFSGTDIIGNVFCRVTSAAFIGGGRDCRIENNVFVDCHPAVHVDARAMGWAKYHADEWVTEGREKGTVSGIQHTRPPYSERYPSLVNILDEEPWAPRGNVLARNLCVGGRWDDFESQARALLTIRDNLIEEDPLFVDRAKRDFRLKPESPAWKLGFERIPLEQIGLYKDQHRATLPQRAAPGD